jgi:hypothetical protein
MSAAIRTETAHPRRTIRSVAAVLAGIAVADLPLGPTGIRSPSSHRDAMRVAGWQTSRYALGRPALAIHQQRSLLLRLGVRKRGGRSWFLPRTNSWKSFNTKYAFCCIWLWADGIKWKI